MLLIDLKSSNNISKDLEGYVHVQGCAHVQEKPEKSLISHHWLKLRMCNRKQRLRVLNCQSVESEPNTHT